MGDRRAGNWEMWIATGIDMGAGTGMGMFWVYGLDELTRGFFSPEFLLNMSASADVLAMAKVEVDLATIPEGKNVSWKHMHGERTTEEERKKKKLIRTDTQVIIKWRGKPVFIRHRTAAEIDEANKVDIKTLRDPQTDEDRVQKPEWLVMLGTFGFGLVSAFFFGPVVPLLCFSATLGGKLSDSSCYSPAAGSTSNLR